MTLWMDKLTMWAIRWQMASLLIILGAELSRGDSVWFGCGDQHTCKIFAAEKNWYDAEATCNREGGHLASIVSVTNDRDKIAQKAKELDITDYWIGLNHLAGLQDTWKFTDNSVVDVDMWATDYPKRETQNELGLIQMCGVEYRKIDEVTASNAGFHNEHCDRYNQYVCKRLTGSTDPIPPTTTKKPPEKFYCPQGYKAIDGEPNMGNKCFKFVFPDNNNGVNWYEAVKQCRNVPGIKSDIASIHGPYEQAFVRSQIVERTFGLWSGLHRSPEGSGWQWLDNTAYDINDNNWNQNPVEPSNNEGEDCAEVLSIPNAAKWNDLYCTQRRGYICQTFKNPDDPVLEPPEPPPKQNCLKGYTPYQFGCYRLLTTTPKSWDDARKECVSHSAKTGPKSDLASIHSDAEDAALHIAVMQSGMMAWIGFREQDDNTFQWSNGWYPTYTNWAADGYDEHMACIAMHHGPKGGWVEVNCSTSLAAICKTTDDTPTKAPSVKDGSCPGEQYGVTNWLKHEAHCYLPVSETKQWHDARLYCAKFDSSATLVSIHNDNENNFVYNNMPKPNSWTEAGWIGLYRHAKDEGFYWTDGSPFAYEKWNLGEPSSKGDDGVDCVRMYTKSHDGHYWDDNSCTNYNPFMCKVEQGAAVQPPPEHAKDCHQGWHKFGAFCYLPFPENTAWWQDAEDYCQKEGGSHLATITNKYQSEFVSDIMMDSGFNTHTAYWIGLKQDRGKATYSWVGTGKEYDPGAFHLFYDPYLEPNVAMGQCAMVEKNSYSGADAWQIRACELPAAYVCELPLESEGLSTGEIAGMVIGVLVAVVALAVLVIYLLDRQGIIDFRKKYEDTKKLIGFSNENYEDGPSATPTGGTNA